MADHGSKGQPTAGEMIYNKDKAESAKSKPAPLPVTSEHRKNAG